ncbi:MAG: heavy metal translocating P-type ATPase [Sediminibacterium sp. Gen4]|jgi:P-type Cu+ transporter|uniref:heavy metal translocating P-type ATPase n=1 Tax=unclassified Sediminibacterium TaxID=2635961 RepID=UPI0015B8CF42|nr:MULTISPECIES: heavy metal translocating P-type ATPase [unclassified Sediminibacterium]MBW0161615.1 heavy metal translocating P-type ATPase [Sediminibacterium sp.]MBW0164214.1 heavy metal translocating P-type ATPase [Sediminibacterium sp.]NWK65494.1 heavy metal translocating P-type ATPase [Sediminibacterium sp. Gen4]
MATESVQMKVSGLMCSFCTMSVEKALKRYPAINSVMVNLVHGIVLVEADTAKMNREQLAEAVEKLGYAVSSTEVQQYKTDEELFSLIKKRGTIGMVASIIDLLVDPLNVFNLPQQYRGYFSLAVAAFVLFWVGYPILRKTIMAVRQRVINANVLLSAGAWGSFIVGAISIYNPALPNFLPVAAWLMSLHLFFGYFKLDTRKKASDAVRKLINLQPAKARVMRGEQFVDVLTKEVIVGEVVEVRPGERIPLDGVVLNGGASVDEASFTGESTPAIKEAGSNVIGGTLNLDGALQIKVSKIGQDSFLSQIVSLMSRIAEKKPPVELLADKLMNYYGPVVFIVAAIAFVVWGLVTGNYIQATLVLLTTIIMGYPCALGITTPMLAAIAGGKGISIGLLVKASEVFYGLSRVDTIVFDKTGTLTYGKPTVTDVHAFNGDSIELLSIAEALESKSEHPIGQAITFFASKEGSPKLSINNFKAIPGKGVIGNINGETVLAGKPSFIEQSGLDVSNEVRNSILALGSEGKTAVLICKGNIVIGVIALQDTPRPTGEQVIAKMKQRGMRTVMLTGDAKQVAEPIAKRLGIDEVQAELLPGEKAIAIEALQKKGYKVAMVGDGINDAPALAQSDVGIAIGAGTDVAIEAAGVILIGDRLIDVLNAVILGKASYKTMTGNVIVAVLFNIVGMLLATFGLITPMLAIVVMIVSIFAILINTLRIRTLKLESVFLETSNTLTETSFKVSNMVCEGCAEKITTALTALPGVKSVKPKVIQKQVHVTYYPEKIKQDELKRVLEKEGFNAVEL